MEILDKPIILSKEKPLNPFMLALLLIGIGSFIGTTTNIINGFVGKEYFQNIMGWDFHEIRKASIVQGLFEGLIYGVIFSSVYTISFRSITKSKGGWKFAIRNIKKIVSAIYICWIIGGLVAILLAFIFPEHYNRFIYKVPQKTISRIGYAWVGGSIWGAMIGSLLSLIFGIVVTNKNWKTQVT